MKNGWQNRVNEIVKYSNKLLNSDLIIFKYYLIFCLLLYNNGFFHVIFIRSTGAEFLILKR